MKKVIQCVVILLFFCGAPVVFGDVFSWTDENGVRHFSDSSPVSRQNNDIDVDVHETAPPLFSHYLFREDKEEGRFYCGNRELLNNESDPPYMLIKAYEKAVSLKKEMDRIRKRSSRGKNTRYDMDVCDCSLNWYENMITKYQPFEKVIISDVDRLEQEAGEEIVECGDRPDKPAYHEDITEWENCEYALKRKEKEMSGVRKSLKIAIGRKKALFRAMEAYNTY